MKCRSRCEKSIYGWVVSSLISLTALNAFSETVYFALDNVILDDSTQINGIISWTYTAGDFENGTRQFLSLTIPHSVHNQDDLVGTIEPGQIEITFEGNVHDDGVDIKLVLVPALTPFTSSLIDTNTTASKYSIGGNGFNDGFFISGRVVPTNLTLSITADEPGFVFIEWSPDIPGVVLQEKPVLATNWMASASGGTNSVVVPVAEPTRFYRAVKP